MGGFCRVLCVGIRHFIQSLGAGVQNWPSDSLVHFNFDNWSINLDPDGYVSGRKAVAVCAGTAGGVTCRHVVQPTKVRLYRCDEWQLSTFERS